LACPPAIHLAIFWLQTVRFAETKSNYRRYTTASRQLLQKIEDLSLQRTLPPGLRRFSTPSCLGAQLRPPLLSPCSPMRLRFPEFHAPLLKAQCQYQFSFPSVELAQGRAWKKDRPRYQAHQLGVMMEASRKSSTHFPCISAAISDTPVMLPPGLARLATSQVPTGHPTRQVSEFH
jgi:hypothetical protein